MADQGAIARYYRTAYPQANAANASYPETYWYRPIRFHGGHAGQMYLGVGADGNFRPSAIAEQVTASGYWRWYRPGVHKVKWRVTASVVNTITVVLKKTTDAAPRPTIRVLRDSRLGVSEATATAAAGTGSDQTLSLSVTPSASGVLIVQMEWLPALPLPVPTEGLYVDWKTVGFS